MSDLSPKLLERRRLRETRYRPWKDVQPISSTITLRRSTLDNPITTYSRIPRLIRRSNPLLICAKLKPIRAKFRPSGSFPFLRLPVEIQVLVGEYVVQYQTPIKCKDFLRCKDNRLDEKANAIPKKTLSKNGYPDWISLLKVCPWLSKDLSRTWYRCNTFYVKSIPEWQAFVTQATWENVYRIRQLRIDNEFMFCLRDNIGKDSDWRSYNLISHLKNLKLLTLYRDDGGPGTYTSGGYEEFDSVEWFVKLATDCKSLQHIRFALYPWSGFAGYSLAKSNMVAWIKDWEHEWNAVMAVRRVKGSKNPQSWYLDISPTAKSQRRQARRGYGVSSLLFDDNNS